ncbi:MAG TPA: MFS transporter [Anaerolineales bacterium]|jgi:MFS family permease|nr:MFS transporter [Anaerolineales bacterium]
MKLAQGSAEPVAKSSSGRMATAFRALRHHNYRLWFSGQGLSLIGTWMQSMAQQVLVYRLTGSAVALGIVSFMTVLPLVPFALWGGSLADRMPKRSIILITQILMMIQAFILSALIWTDAVQIWHVYVMAFLLGAFKAVDMPARQSFVIEMVEGRGDLTSAIGLNSAMHNTAKTLGPALAGVFVALLGEAVAFLLNGLSFFAVIVSLLWMRDLPSTRVEKEQQPEAGRHMIAGMRYVLGQQTLLILMSLVAVNSFLSRPYQTLLPVFANGTLKESAQPMIAFLCNGRYQILNCQAPEAIPLGLLLSAVGVGALTGAFLVASLSETARRGRMLTLGNLCLPFFLLIFVNSHSMAFSLVVMLFVGMSHVFQNSMANTLLQLNVPDQLRGRVMSLYALVSNGMMNLGGLQAGFMADWLGAPLSIGLGAGFSLLYGCFVALRYREVRNLS